MQIRKTEKSKQNTSESNLDYPEQTTAVDLQILNQAAQQLQTPKIGNIYSHSLCPKSQRIVLNTDMGFALVKDGKIKKYFQKGPFLGKDRGTGVRISSLLGNRNLIALVPDRNTVITTDTQGKMSLQESSVYIYDININCVIYQHRFNKKITSVQLTEKYIIAGDRKRIIAVDYTKDKKGDRGLDELFEIYETKNARLPVRYFETGCLCEVECQCGKVVSNIEEPRIIAFSYYNKQLIGIFNTQLNYHYDIDIEQPYQDFCLSQNGKYLALASSSGTSIQVIDLSTRKLFTEFRRGFQAKKSICMRFFMDWFGIIYNEKNQATLHLFKMKKKEEKEVINSKFKRYFNTYSFGVDFMVKKGELTLVSLIGAEMKALDIKIFEATHAEEKRTIRHNELRMWVEGEDSGEE